MATRFYLNTTPQTTVSGTVNSAWTGSYSGFDRYFLESTASSAFSTQSNTATMTSGNSYCLGQWWSHPISNAASFTGSDWNLSTWTFLMRHSESHIDANYVYKIQLRIYNGSFDWNNLTTGGTEFDVGDGSATNSLMESRRCSGCDIFSTPTNAPYANSSIRLVAEIGVYKSAGTSASHTAYSEVGGNSGTDLVNDQTGISQYNPWLECSLNFTFDAEASDSSSNLMLMGVG